MYRPIKWLLASMLAFAFAGTALADGITYRQPRIAAPVQPAAPVLFNYTGLYASAGIGGAIALGELEVDKGASGSASVDSLAAYAFPTGDVRLGFDWQAGGLVFGLLGGYQLGEPEFNVRVDGNTVLNGTIEREWYGGGRLGMVLPNRSLVYAGYIFMPQELVINGQGFDLSPHNVIGGFEMPLANQFTLSMEYKYTLPEDVGLGGGLNVNTDVHEGSIRLNWRPAALF